jgi:hypothetical protein
VFLESPDRGIVGLLAGTLAVACREKGALSHVINTDVHFLKSALMLNSEEGCFLLGIHQLTVRGAPFVLHGAHKIMLQSPEISVHAFLRFKKRRRILSQTPQ